MRHFNAQESYINNRYRGVQEKELKKNHQKFVQKGILVIFALLNSRQEPPHVARQQSGCSAVRLARQLRELEVPSSNLGIPTKQKGVQPKVEHPSAFVNHRGEGATLLLMLL